MRAALHQAGATALNGRDGATSSSRYVAFPPVFATPSLSPSPSPLPENLSPAQPSSPLLYIKP